MSTKTWTSHSDQGIVFFTPKEKKKLTELKLRDNELRMIEARKAAMMDEHRRIQAERLAYETMGRHAAAEAHAVERHRQAQGMYASRISDVEAEMARLDRERHMLAAQMRSLSTHNSPFTSPFASPNGSPNLSGLPYTPSMTNSGYQSRSANTSPLFAPLDDFRQLSLHASASQGRGHLRSASASHAAALLDSDRHFRTDVTGHLMPQTSLQPPQRTRTISHSRTLSAPMNNMRFMTKPLPDFQQPAPMSRSRRSSLLGGGGGHPPSTFTISQHDEYSARPRSRRTSSGFSGQTSYEQAAHAQALADALLAERIGSRPGNRSRAGSFASFNSGASTPFMN